MSSTRPKTTQSNEASIWNGKTYAKNSTPQAKRNLAALHELNLGCEDTVLDVGCGSGETTRIMAMLVNSIKGIDNNDSMIEKANGLARNIKHLTIEKADARDFRFDQQFSVITSFFCLQWVPKNDLHKTFTNIHRHLADDGKICILLPCYDFPHEVIKGMANTAKWKDRFEGFKDAQSFENEAFYLWLLSNIGFGELQITVLQSEHLMTNEEFILYTQQWCGCYNWLKTENDRDDFINDLQKRLDQEPHAAETNQFTMIQKSLRIFGKKHKKEVENTPDPERQLLL